MDAPPFVEGDNVGYSSIAGQILNKGTTTKTKAEIDEAIDFIGASLSTWSSGIYGASLTKHKETMLKIMADVLKNPSFPKDEFEKIKKQTLSNLAASKEDPSSMSANVSDAVIYGKDHPYGEVETEASVNEITLEDIKNYYKKYFTPAQSYLIIVGDINESSAKDLAKKYFGDWKGGSKVTKEKFTNPSAPDNTQVNFVQKDGAVQSVIKVTYPVQLKPGSMESIKGRVMNSLLGGYFGSRLNANLRETNAYTYGSGSSLSSDKEVGYFSAGASVRNEVTDSAIVEIMNELNKLRTELVSDEELQMVKNDIAGSFARGLESPQTIASFALTKFKYNLPDDYYETYLKKINSVTKEDVMEMAKKFLKPDNAHIVVVGNKDEVADKLTKFAKDGKVNFYDYKGDPVKYEEMEVPSDMTAEKVYENYLAAIGGETKLNSLKDIKMVQNIEVQGMKITSTTYIKSNDKVLQEQAMNGNVMSKSVINGDKGYVSQMGQKQNLEGPTLKAAKSQAELFPERDYTKNGYKLELAGMENIDGKNVYKVVAVSPDGTKNTSFYDVSNGLKVRSVTTMQVGPQSITQTIDYKDYKAVNGIMFPHVSVVSGLMPMPVETKVESIEVNSGLKDELFTLE